MTQTVTHRDLEGPVYKGIPIHTLPGLHEYVYSLVEKYFAKECAVIEFGAGSGAMSLRLMDGGYNVSPLELDAKDWKLEQQPLLANLNDSGWIKETLQDKKYSGAVAIEIIEHLENPSKFFRDISKVLEPGGVLVLTTPNILFFDSLMLAVKRGDFCMYSPGECQSTGHITLLPWWLTKYFGVNNGFILEHVSGACNWPIGESSKQNPNSLFGRFSLMGIKKKISNIKKSVFRRVVERHCGRVSSKENLITDDYTNIVFVFKKAD